MEQATGTGYEYGTIVLIGLGAYMVILLGIGWWASKRVVSESDYLVAGRRLGLVLSTGALIATWYGAGTTMGAAGAAFTFGNQGVLFDPYGAALCLIVVGLVFARLVRRGRYLTMVDLFGLRYGKHMGLAAGFAIVIAEMGWVGALLVGFGTIIEFFTGLPLGWGIGLGTVVLVIYTYLGGMWALTLTDALQMAIIILSMVVMLLIAVPLAGGWDAVFDTSAANNMLNLNQWDFFPTSAANADPEYGNAGFLYYTGHMGWFYWAAALMAIGFGSITAQDLAQRMLSARDERTSVWSCIIAGVLYLVLGLVPVILGMIAFKLYPDLGFEDVKNKVLLIMAAEHLPLIGVVLFVCGLVAALMSSAAAAILAAASIIGYNGMTTFNPEVSDKTTLFVTRLCVPIITAAALVLALRFETIYNLMVVAWTVLLVGLFAPYVAAFFWKKANGMGALAAFIAGFAVWIFAYYLYLPATMAANTDVVPGVEGVYFDWAMWDALYIASIWGLLASIVCLVVFSLLTQRIDPPQPIVDIDRQPLDTGDWFGPAALTGDRGEVEAAAE
ncbi:MAG: sodium:solute symporter family protein [Alphaproteobacteria bacterium]